MPLITLDCPVQDAILALPEADKPQAGLPTRQVIPHSIATICCSRRCLATLTWTCFRCYAYECHVEAYDNLQECLECVQPKARRRHWPTKTVGLPEDELTALGIAALRGYSEMVKLVCADPTR